MEIVKHLEGMPKANGYKCPNCATGHCDRDTGYKCLGEKYPIYVNERSGWNGDDYHDWEEIHRCKKCKTIYYFTNGAY